MKLCATSNTACCVVPFGRTDVFVELTLDVSIVGISNRPGLLKLFEISRIGCIETIMKNREDLHAMRGTISNT
jgi:hypothetical protein